MEVLVTGAFGRLGSMVVAEARRRGWNLRCHDLDTPAAQRAARHLATANSLGGGTPRCDVRLGDLAAEPDLSGLLDGVDGVIHTAALLPPVTEQRPVLAEQVNVDTTRRLIDAASALTAPPHVVFPSTLSVFSRTQDRPRARTATDPVEGSDNYTRHKLAIERHLEATERLPWTVLRVGVSVDARTLSTDRGTLRALLRTSRDNPVHWVHPKDVAYAMCQALEVPAARGKVLLIGGAPDCQVTQERFAGAAFRALGLRYPAEVHGDAYYYTHWLDTTESQDLLGFQHRGFDVYEAELASRLRWPRRLLAPLRPLVNPTLAPLLRRV